MTGIARQRVVPEITNQRVVAGPATDQIIAQHSHPDIKPHTTVQRAPPRAIENIVVKIACQQTAASPPRVVSVP